MFRLEPSDKQSFLQHQISQEIEGCIFTKLPSRTYLKVSAETPLVWLALPLILLHFTSNHET